MVYQLTDHHLAIELFLHVIRIMSKYIDRVTIFNNSKEKIR